MTPEGLPDLVVAASGNLANIYFPGGTERLTLEDMVQLHPGLMEGLVAHPGIGFALVRSSRLRCARHRPRGHPLPGPGPRRRAATRWPPFGPHAPDNLRRLDSFSHVGDILVNSMYDPSTDEIAPFEHQVGAHGGLGGPQTKAFVLYPTALEAGTDPVALVGAEQVNARIRRLDGARPRSARRARGGRGPAVTGHRHRSSPR